MSELIVRMEPPKLCFECFFRLDCELYMNEVMKPFGKRDFTAFKPLVNGCLIRGVLPEKHGDLIDRDVAIQTFKCIEEAPYSVFDGQEAFYTPEDVVNTLLCQDVAIAAERKDDETYRC